MYNYSAEDKKRPEKFEKLFKEGQLTEFVFHSIITHKDMHVATVLRLASVILELVICTDIEILKSCLKELSKRCEHQAGIGGTTISLNEVYSVIEEHEEDRQVFD